MPSRLSMLCAYAHRMDHFHSSRLMNSSGVDWYNLPADSSPSLTIVAIGVSVVMKSGTRTSAGFSSQQMVVAALTYTNAAVVSSNNVTLRPCDARTNTVTMNHRVYKSVVRRSNPSFLSLSLMWYSLILGILDVPFVHKVM